MQFVTKALALALLVTTSMVWARVDSYTVVVSNRSDSNAVIEFSQYRAEDYGSTRPAVLTAELLIRERRVSISAGETVEVWFNDAAGGYWLTWRLLEPESTDPTSGALDLLHDELEIVLE